MSGDPTDSRFAVATYFLLVSYTEKQAHTFKDYVIALRSGSNESLIMVTHRVQRGSEKNNSSRDVIFAYELSYIIILHRSLTWMVCLSTLSTF